MGPINWTVSMVSFSRCLVIGLMTLTRMRWELVTRLAVFRFVDRRQRAVLGQRAFA